MTQDFAVLLQGRVAFRSRESDQWPQVTEWHGSHCPTAQLDGSLIELSKTREKLRQKYIEVTVRQTEEEIKLERPFASDRGQTQSTNRNREGSAIVFPEDPGSVSPASTWQLTTHCL